MPSLIVATYHRSTASLSRISRVQDLMQVRTVLALALHAGGNHPGASLSWLRRSHWPGQQSSPFGSLRTVGTTGEIAQDFFLVIDIVKKHTSHILSRVEATSRTHAVALARLLGLIP